MCNNCGTMRGWWRIEWWAPVAFKAARPLPVPPRFNTLRLDGRGGLPRSCSARQDAEVGALSRLLRNPYAKYIPIPTISHTPKRTHVTHGRPAMR